MSKEEILELMELKGWDQTQLAANLRLSQYAVQKWISQDRNPGGPACILMRDWLEKARKAKELAEAE